MKLKLSFCFVILSLFFLNQSVSQTPLKFYPSKNIENHEGEEDLMVKEISYNSDNNKLTFNIKIKDDEVILRNGKINSDHLEFWFTVNEKTDTLYSLNSDEFNTGWQYYETGDDPKTPFNVKKMKFIDDYQIWTEFNNFEKINIINPDVSTRKELTGTSHWGVFRDTALFFDQEMYFYFPVKDIPVGSKPSFNKTEDGYEISISFSPEQIFFMKNIESNKIKLNIVVFDQDESGLSIHSVTPNYDWGVVNDFPSIALNPPLTIPLPASYRDLEESHEVYLPYYMHLPGSEFKWELFTVHDDRERFYQSVYNKWHDPLPLDRKGLKVGKHDFFYYEQPKFLFFPIGKAWIRTDYSLDEVKSLEPFYFNDSSIGFYNYQYYMQNPYGHGPCGACDHEVTEIYHIGENGPQRLLTADQNLGNIVCQWGDIEVELDWEWMPDFSQQSWVKEENKLILPVINEVEGDSSKVLHITWDEKWKSIVEVLDRK